MAHVRELDILAGSKLLAACYPDCSRSAREQCGLNDRERLRTTVPGQFKQQLSHASVLPSLAKHVCV